MTDMYRYTCEEPARLIFSNIVVKSAPKVASGDAKARYSGTFGIGEKDFDAIRKMMVEAVKSVTGEFGNPQDYYLPCLSGKAMAERTMLKAEFDARGLKPDEAFRLKEKAEKRAETYRPYAAVLQASSQFDISLARLEGGKIIDIGEAEHVRVQAGKDYFYPGAWVAPAIAIKGTKRKKVDDKDGCTAFLQNVLFIRKGERLGGGGGPDNSTVYGSWAGYSSVDPTALAPQEPETASAW